MSESADIPVCSSLGMVGGAEELIDRADSDPSRPEGTAGAAGGGVTAESCTCRRETFSLNLLKNITVLSNRLCAC